MSHHQQHHNNHRSGSHQRSSQQQVQQHHEDPNVGITHAQHHQQQQQQQQQQAAYQQHQQQLQQQQLAEDQRAMEQSFKYARYVAEYVAEKCTENHQYLDTTHFTRFHSSGIPNITLPDYFRRVAKYSHCSAECFIVALCYIQKYCEASKSALTLRNAHRLTICAVMLAAKLRDDVFYANKYYSSIGGISGREINELELDLLVTINWETWVEREHYDIILKEVTAVAARREQEALAAQKEQQLQQRAQQGMIETGN